MIAIYPGSFDPITIGHYDIIRRSSILFDEVIVAIMEHPLKNPTFTLDERILMIEDMVRDLGNVRVVFDSGLTINLAKKLNARVLIRGIRAVMDYEMELRNASVNKILDDDIETLFLLAMPEYSFISSSAIKEIAFHNGDFSRFVSPMVYEKLKVKYQK